MDNELKTFEGVADDTNIPAENTAAITPETATVQVMNSEPVDLSYVDPLLKEQQHQVDQMRSTLLTFNKTDVNSAKKAMQNITVMRVYHQVSRIIRFIEMMDKLEDKLYDSIDMSISGMDSADPATMLMLLKVQSQLQETMIQSQQLLKPYLDMDIATIAPAQDVEDTSFGAALISQSSRNNIRSGAQALLTELKKSNPDLSQDDQKAENTPADNKEDTSNVRNANVK